MDADKLLARIAPKNGHYPVTPDEAARLIVSELLSDLSQERRDTIAAVIEEYASDYANFVADVASTSLEI